MAIGQQGASIQCPVCQTRFTVPVENIIDVDERPDLKNRLLQGQLNLFPCPSCRNVVGLTTPLLYHDGDKGLLFCLTPANTSLGGNDTQKMIGTLTNALLNRLPAEKRKAYLFQPKMFLTLESMIEAILEADGITKEMIEAQRAKIALIEQLLEAQADEEKIKSLVAENETLFDHEFFQLLAAVISAAQAEQQSESLQILLSLRRTLLPLTQAGREIMEAEQKLREEVAATKEEFLKRLVDAKDETEVDALVRSGRPFLDYAFFQEFTRKIEGATAEEAKRLKARREQILTVSERQDEEMKTILTARAELLKKLLQSREPESVLREEAASLDEAFFTVLSANAQQAAQAGQKEAVEALQRIGTLAVRVVQENAPPVVKLINQLADEDEPAARTRMLQQNKELVNDEFFDIIAAMSAELAEMGRDEVAERLDAIGNQARIVFGIG